MSWQEFGTDNGSASGVYLNGLAGGFLLFNRGVSNQGTKASRTNVDRYGNNFVRHSYRVRDGGLTRCHLSQSALAPGLTDDRRR